MNLRNKWRCLGQTSLMINKESLKITIPFCQYVKHKRNPKILSTVKMKRKLESRLPLLRNSTNSKKIVSNESEKCYALYLIFFCAVNESVLFSEELF